MLAPETEIIVTKDGAEILRKIVTPGDYVIGREPGCDVYLDVEMVSRRHAQLTVNFDHSLIEDLGSKNGTFVNGQPVTEPTRLWPNQKIQVGSATIELRRLKPAAPLNASLAPQVETVQRLLPEEFLRDKKYDIGKVVARGGMGVILDATEATIERRVAMKVMLDGSSPADLTRFIAEAKITGQLEHPNVIPVHELGIDENGQPFYTMKMVRGITLRKVLELLAEGVPETVKKYPLPTLLTIFQKVCDALAFAHSKGVIHRDLKPDNIMLDDFGVVLVMDWGLAKVIAKATADAGAGDAARTAVRTLPPQPVGSTLAGTVMGTPQYMSPEQARGEVETLDARSDIYALGAILYHILALRPPVSGADAWAVVEKVAKGEIEPLVAARAPSPARAPARKAPPSGEAGVGTVSGAGAGETWRQAHAPAAGPAPAFRPSRIPDGLAAVVRKAMALDRTQRYAGVADLQRDIEAYQGGFATSAEKAGAFKQAALFIKRNKTLSIAAALIVALVACFMATVIASERKARATLAELRATVPLLRSEAIQLINNQQFADALARLNYLNQLAPDSADLFALKGNVLQSLLRFAEARAAYSQALRLAPKTPFATENITFCDKLAAAATGDATTAAMIDLQRAMNQQNRFSEEMALSQRLGQTRAQLIARCVDVLRRAGVEEDAIKSLQTNPDGRLNGDFSGSQVENLPLKGMPFTTLNLARTKVRDLSFLKGMPLESLDLGRTDVEDLAPLKGMALKTLRLNNTRVSDLSPLAGMPLNELTANDSRIASLAPLKGMPVTILRLIRTRVSDLAPIHDLPLKILLIAETPVSDFSPLRGLKLTELNLKITKISSLDVLEGMPLTILDITHAEVADLSPLHGMPLTHLSMSQTKVTDLSPLHGMPIDSLDLSNTKVASLLPLRGMPLTSFAMAATGLSDLRPLRGMPLKTADFYSTPVADLSPLAGMPLENLHMDFTKASDLSPLKGMPLRTLWLNNSGGVSDLSPLAGTPITELHIENTNVRDISPLKGMPLRALRCAGCKELTNLHPLENCLTLQELSFPGECQDFDFLRRLPALRHLASSAVFKKTFSLYDILPPAADFWKEYDAQKKAAALK